MYNPSFKYDMESSVIIIRPGRSTGPVEAQRPVQSCLNSDPLHYLYFNRNLSFPLFPYLNPSANLVHV